MPLVLTGAVVLLAGAALAVLLDDNRRRVAAAVVSQAIATVLVLSSVVPVLFGGAELHASLDWSQPIGVIDLRVDALSAFFLAFSLPLTLLGSSYGIGYMAPYMRSDRNVGVHFALLNTTCLSFVMIYTIENTMAFYIAWEIAALSAWLLVIWDYKSQKIRFAGFNYLVSTHISFLFLIAATMIMVSKTGSADFAAFEKFLRSNDPLRDVTFLLLFCAFALKSAFFPFHTWLPRAHAAAPAHVSALMSGVIHKAGLYGLLRFTLLLGVPDIWMAYFLLVLSLLSAVTGAVYSALQRDLKRLLGYASTENVGIAGIGIAIGYCGLVWRDPALVCLGFSAGLLHILNHAVFKCLLFYGAGAVQRATGTVDIERLGGLHRAMPYTALFFLVGTLAISGLPPLNGFLSELLVFTRAVLSVAATLMALVGGVSLLSMVRAFAIPFLGTPREPTRAVQGDASGPMLLVMGAHAALAVLLGVVPSVGLLLVREPVRELLSLLGTPGRAFDGELPLEILAPVAGLSLALVVVTVLLVVARRRYLPAPRALPHVTWGCGYTRPEPRMQYTAGSFSSGLAVLLASALVSLRREKLPDAFFPRDGRLETSCVDGVERRMFEVLSSGDDVVKSMAAGVPETPRLSFALGLGTLIVTVGLLLLAREAGP